MLKVPVCCNPRVLNFHKSFFGRGVLPMPMATQHVPAIPVEARRWRRIPGRILHRP